MPAKSFCVLWAFLCFFSGFSSLLAQEIRWKFSVGDQFVIAQQQTTNIDTLVEKRKSSIDSSVTLRANWKVTAVDDSAVATIEQTIDSIKITVNNPADNTKSVAIDTASQQKPAKNSRDLQKQLKPLMGMTFILMMNDRGEVIDVSVPEKTQQLLNAIPAESRLNQSGNARLRPHLSLKALLDPVKLTGQIRNATLALPERDLPEGQSVEILPSQNSATAVAAPLGKRKMTYNGQRSVDGHQADIFSLSTTEKFDAADAKSDSDVQMTGRPDVAAFEWNGKMVFDRDAGHCMSCKQQTTIATARSYRDMEMSTNVVVKTVFQLQRK